MTVDASPPDGADLLIVKRRDVAVALEAEGVGRRVGEEAAVRRPVGLVASEAAVHPLGVVREGEGSRLLAVAAHAGIPANGEIVPARDGLVRIVAIRARDRPLGNRMAIRQPELRRHIRVADDAALHGPCGASGEGGLSDGMAVATTDPRSRMVALRPAGEVSGFPMAGEAGRVSRELPSREGGAAPGKRVRESFAVTPLATRVSRISRVLRPRTMVRIEELRERRRVTTPTGGVSRVASRPADPL